MGPRLVLATLALWVVGAAEAIAQRAGRGAPEIDGPAGIAALVLLVGVGLLAYNRFRK
jgi:hypothetical protein